jgi:GTP-binding protein
MKVAIVGKRNVGKSTFINALAGEERVIVSEVPGTTRDAVDVTFEMAGRTFVAIDTAGVRKKSRLDDIEFYGYARAKRAIGRADVALLMIDSTAEVGQVDKHLARLVAEEYKPCVLVINKWDLAKDRAGTDAYGEYLTKILPELDFAPISFTTANRGRNVQSTIDLASTLFKQARARVTTGQLNQALEAILSLRGPSSKRGAKRPKIYYATQVSSCPPTVVCFVNDVSAIKQDYQRFIANRFRELLPFDEIPIRLLFRSHRGRRPRNKAGKPPEERVDDGQD